MQTDASNNTLIGGALLKGTKPAVAFEKKLKDTISVLMTCLTALGKKGMLLLKDEGFIHFII